jgi:prepilin signal peptidase PulO-like enzyme (type II secretory pathway)
VAKIKIIKYNYPTVQYWAKIRAFIFTLSRVWLMSSDQNFKETSSKRHLVTALIVMFAAPLLPMLMGWLTVLV